MRSVYYIKNEAEVHGLSVRNMQRITIYALKKHRKAILESLQRKGVLEVENLQLEDSAFIKEQTAQKQALFLKTSSAAGQAYEALCSYLPEKRKLLSMFEGRSLISVAEYDSFVAESSEIMRTAYRVNDLQKAVSDAKAEIIRLQTQIEALQPWKTFDIPLRFQGTVATAAFIGTLPEFFSYAQLLSRLARLLPQIQDLALEIVSASQEQTCFFLVCSRSSAQQVEEALRSMGYARPPADSEFTPVQRIAQLKEHIREEKDAIETAQAEIISYAGMKNAFRFMEDYYVMRAEKYSIIERLENTKHMFLLTGYAMADRVHEIASELTKKYGAAVEVEQPKEKEAPPVALQNNRFAQPVESVLETYSLPARGEVDPTFVMSIFYYIFFGMMFSDAGYGLVMTLGCAFLLKKFKNMEEGLKKSVKMFLGCGISTVFWGVLFGSYFGDAVTVIGKTFFQVDVAIPPLWFNPVEGTNSMTLLMVAFLLGIIHIFVGLGMQGYMHIKNGRPLDAVCRCAQLVSAGGRRYFGAAFHRYAQIPDRLCAAARLHGYRRHMRSSRGGADPLLCRKGLQAGQAFFKGRLRIIWGHGVFKRYSVLFKTVGAWPGDRRHCTGFQPDRRHVWRRDRHIAVYSCFSYRAYAQYQHQCFGGLRAYQPLAVCRVFWKVL